MNDRGRVTQSFHGYFSKKVLRAKKASCTMNNTVRSYLHQIQNLQNNIL